MSNNVYSFKEKSETGIYWLTEHTGLFMGPTNVGIVCVPASNNSKDVYLIDSGPDKNFADIVYKALKAELKDFSIKAIIDTHSHADHAGANAEFVRRTGCKILATQKEKSSIECPDNQSAIAYGADPLPEYKTSYYFAEPSLVDTVIKSDEEITVSEDVTLKCIPLPGHYFEMVGILCKDKTSAGEKTVFFTSDGIFTRGMLAKYWIPFMYNVGQFKESLDTIKSVKADFYVPSHGDIYTEIAALYELNMLSVIQNEETILQCLKKESSTFEDILKYIADSNDMSMRLSQFMLVGSTIRSYITYLYTQEKITWVFRDNKMYWKIKE